MVDNDENVKCKIWKKECKVMPNGQYIEERQLEIIGKNLKEVAKEFDKRWKYD